MEEIARLNNEIHGRDENIKSRRTNLTTLESHTAMLRKCSNDYKVKRDELHEERKFVYLVFFFFVYKCFFWMKKIIKLKKVRYFLPFIVYEIFLTILFCYIIGPYGLKRMNLRL